MMSNVCNDVKIMTLHQKVYNPIKKYIIMSNRTSCASKLPHDVHQDVKVTLWSQRYVKKLPLCQRYVMRSKVKKFVKISKCSSWRQKVRQKYFTTSKQNYAMTSKTSKKFRHYVKNTSWHHKVSHETNNTSWRQAVRHDVKSTWKVHHDVKNIVITSKSMLCNKKVCYGFKNCSWS